MEAFSAIPIKGYSAGIAPSQVNTMNVPIKHQNRNRLPIESLIPLNKAFRFLSGYTNRIKIALNKAMTPPNLSGTARRIAYANKKYHSGWICVGVTNIFAGIKFSGSMNLYPYIHLNNTRLRIKMRKNSLSLTLK